MTSHWKRYKKATLKFPENEFNLEMCQSLFDNFILESKSILTDYKFWWDYGDKQTGYHVNLYLKSSDKQRLRRNYQGKDRLDQRMFLWLGDLEDIQDTCTWISYASMRQKVNFAPQFDRVLSNNHYSF